MYDLAFCFFSFYKLIERFLIYLTGGPKNYAYTLNDGETHLKIRGFNLNFKNLQIINFDSVKALVRELDFASTLSITNNFKITTDGKKRKVYNKIEEKKYRLVYDKRVILSDYKTVPYGF